MSIFLYFWEKIKRYHFSYFEYLSKNSPKLNQNYYWLWVYFGISVSNGQIRTTVLNYTVYLMHGSMQKKWIQKRLFTLISGGFVIPVKILLLHKHSGSLTSNYSKGLTLSSSLKAKSFFLSLNTWEEFFCRNFYDLSRSLALISSTNQLYNWNWQPCRLLRWDRVDNADSH